MPVTQTLAITPAQRLDNLRYAIRDLVGLANDIKKQGNKILYLNVGDPNIFDFATPPHVIDAAYRAMRDGYVDETWAKEHHLLWYDEVKAGRRSERILPKDRDRTDIGTQESDHHSQRCCLARAIWP